MTFVFLSELIIKIIASGFICNGPKSYMRTSWNVMDFFIVFVSIISICFSHLDLSFLKAFRMLRILRPLRLIQRNKSLKLAVTSLINSMPAIIRLEVILIFFMFLMGTLCSTLLGGKFYACRIGHISFYDHQNGLFDELLVIGDVIDRHDCLNIGGEWTNEDNNYDTVISSLITL